MQEEIVHQFNDPSHKRLVQLLIANPEFEGFIKNASLDVAFAEDLPETAFAWPERRLFPIDHEDNASLSYLYAEKNASVPGYVKAEIKKALDLYEVKLPITTEKSASVIDTQNSNTYLLPEKRRWLVKDGETVKLAQAALHENKRYLTYTERLQAATSLVKEADVHHVDVSNDFDLMKTAGLTASNLDDTKTYVEMRATISPPEWAGVYNKLASDLSKAEAVCYNREALIKLAQVIEDYDNGSGCSKYWNKKFPDPVMSVFNTEKRAESTIDLAGVSVPLSKLAGISVGTYSDIFGSDVVREITTSGEVDTTKIANVLATLPRDLKVVLRKQIGY